MTYKYWLVLFLLNLYVHHKMQLGLVLPNFSLIIGAAGTRDCWVCVFADLEVEFEMMS